MTTREPITFEVNHAAVAQPRPRARAMQLPDPKNPGRKKWTAQITAAERDHPVHVWKFQVLDAWRLVMPHPGFRFEGPLDCRIRILTERPQRLIWQTKEMPRIPDERGPHGSNTGDVDNMAKSILDALNGKAFEDDRQICRLIVEKWICAGSEQPQATVQLAPMDQAPAPAFVSDRATTNQARAILQWAADHGLDLPAEAVADLQQRLEAAGPPRGTFQQQLSLFDGEAPSF